MDERHPGCASRSPLSNLLLALGSGDGVKAYAAELVCVGMDGQLKGQDRQCDHCPANEKGVG